MAKNNMTAVEWLIEQISEKQPNGFYVIDTLEDVKRIFEQAKQMEKERHDKWNEFLNAEKTLGVSDVKTIAEVVMWLYEKHEIWISVDWMSRTKPYNSGFYCHLRGTNKNLNQDNFVSINNTKEPGYEVFNSPTDAYSSAIEYTLNKKLLTEIMKADQKNGLYDHIGNTNEMVTAVEWYYQKTVIEEKTNYWELFEQAKQMEREQIMNAYKAHHDIGHIYDAEQYYSETYNK